MLRPGRDGCEAQVRAPWSRRVVARARGDGLGVPGLVAALAALRLQGLQALPKQALLLVPDERAYLSLRPAQARRPQALQEAKAHFERLLDRRDLQVQVAPLPGGGGWLAAAIESSDLDTWRRALAAEGITLTHVQLAALGDLGGIAKRVGDRALVALMRDEGMTVVRTVGGVPTEISWERCDQDSQRCIEQRLLAVQKVAETEVPEPLTILCRSVAQLEEWQSRARGHGWTLLSQDAPEDAAAALLAQIRALAPEQAPTA